MTDSCAQPGLAPRPAEVLILRRKDMSHAPTDRPWVSTTYYADGRVQRTVDPYDGVRKWVLDGEGDRVTQVRHAAPGGLARALAIEGFDGMGNPLAVTDFDGTRWTMAYSPRNEVVSMCPEVGDEEGEGEGACRERAYLLDGSVLSETDLDGHETRYRYDELGRVAEIVDPLGLSRTFAWSIGEELHSVTDHRGWMDVMEHDAWGRVVRRLEGRANALVEIERRVVDGLGRVLEVQDARGHVTRMSYDGRGLMERLELPPVAGVAHAEERTYNAAGHLERMVDGDGVVVAFETDAVGRVVEEVLAPETLAEARTSLRYDAMGRLTEVVRPRHQDSDVARRMEWDGLGRLARVVDEAGNETHHEWDASDRLLEVWEGPRDTEGVLRSSYRYTALGYLTRHEQWVGPEGERLVTEWLEHSGEGYPGRRVTASGEELLEWDAVGRPLRSEIRALGETSEPGIWRAALREWEYLDEQGLVRLTEASFDPEAAGVFDGNGFATATALAQVVVVDTTERLFDERGWLRRETVVRPEGELEVLFDYDANGNRRSQITMGVGLENPEATRWEWDARNRLQHLETPGGTSTWTHTPGGRVSRIDYANGTRATFQHEALTGRMSAITHREGAAGSAEVMAAVSYTYDLNGNRASQELAIGGVTETTTYTYDAVDQLRAFSVVPGAGAAPDAHTRHTWYGHERYRRVYEGRCRGGTLVPDVSAAGGMRCDGDGMQTMDSTLTYDGPHGQISQVSNALGQHSAGEGASLVTYEHDAAGNLVERRTHEITGGDPQVEVDLFRYDALDRLVEVARGPPGAEAVVGQYGYNADGLRTRVRESGRNADAWYDGLALLMERVEQGGGGSEWNTVRYHHDPGGLHAITADHDGEGTRTTHFAHRDAMGSTLAVSRPDAGALGLVAASYRTDPWGMVTAETGVDHVNHSVFTGHQHDADTGLIYMRARFYDPALGQFLSADSWLGDAGNPPSLQRYLYAYGNPGVWWDPDGRLPIPTLGARAANELCQAQASTPEERAACVMGAHGRVVHRLAREDWREECERDLRGHPSVDECVQDTRRRRQGLMAQSYRLEETRAAREQAERAERQQQVAADTVPAVANDTIRVEVDVLEHHGEGRGIYGDGLTGRTRNQIDPDTPSTLSCANIRSNADILRCEMEGDYGASDYVQALSDAGVESVREQAGSIGPIRLLLESFGRLTGLRRSPLSLPPGRTATQWRDTPGIATGGQNLPPASTIRLHGSSGQAMLPPREVAEALRGQRFESLREFREAFWRAMADTPAARQFDADPSNLYRMRAGSAPIVPASQTVRGADVYVLHHITPLHSGGGVYDLNNIVIVTCSGSA